MSGRHLGTRPRPAKVPLRTRLAARRASVLAGPPTYRWTRHRSSPKQSEGTSYLELAQFLRSKGDGAFADADLEQLFRRVAFYVAMGNRDDHLRNHGFILGATG
ncbi:MAG: HipA domain-containing protein [Rhodoferax sp.]|nr:HipA domain-containing protein [Rhodoferax sp.]